MFPDFDNSVSEDVVVETSNDFSMSRSSTQMSSSISSSKKRKIQDTTSEAIDSAIKNLQNSEKIDYDEMFLLSYADSLRRMEIEEKSRVKFEISSLFKFATYKK